MHKILYLILLTNIMLLANGKPTIVDKEIMNLGLNFEFKKADQLLSSQFKNTDNLKNHFLYLNIELLKVIKATDDVPYNQKRAIKDSLNKKLITYAEKVVDEYVDEELSNYDKFYLGSVHGVLGRLYGVSREMMSAFSSGKKGKNLMEEVIEVEPDFVDAYLLLGMMNYYADRLGGITEFFASILGLSGDRNIGLQYLERVEKEGVINNWQATMILIELYSRMEENKFASLPLLEKMVARFPNNTHFKNWLCYEYLNLHQLKKAGYLISADASNEINDFVKASYYSQAGDYEKSNQIYNQLLLEKGLIWPWVYENSKFTRVMNYFYLDEIEQVKNLSADLNERYSKRLNEIMANPTLIKEISNFRTAVSLDEDIIASKFIANRPAFGDLKTLEASFNYYLAIYYFKNSNYNKAEKYFNKCKEDSFNEYGNVASRYLIHIYLNHETEIEKVEKLLDDIDDLDNDDLEFFAQDLEIKYDL